MVAPFIAAGVMAVARFITKKGIQLAVKKYGKKAVQEARKHAKDMTTKPKDGKKVPPTKLQGQYRKGTRIAFGVGAAGAGAGGVAKSLSDNKKLQRQKKITAATSAKDKREANEKLGNQAKALQKKLAKERAAKRKATTAAERAKRQVAIEKLVGQVVVANTKAKLLNEKLKDAPRPKLRPTK